MRTRLLPICILAVLVPVAAHASFISTLLSTNPVAYWRMNAADETSLVNGYVLYWDGGVTLGPGAPIAEDPGNQAAVLNGGAADMRTPTLPLGGAVTMAGWFNLAGMTGDWATFFAQTWSGDDLDVLLNPDNANVYFYTGRGSELHYAPPGGFSLGTWYFLAVTLDSGYKSIYIDGLKVADAGGSGHGENGGPFDVGASPGWGGRYFDGSLDEVAVWTRALSPDEIGSIYAAAADEGGVPEPSAFALAAAGLLALAVRRRMTR